MEVEVALDGCREETADYSRGSTVREGVKGVHLSGDILKQK